MPTGARHAIDTIFRPEARTRGTLLSVANEIPAAQLVENGVNRLGTGITWLPLPDIVLNRDGIECDTVYDKTPRGVPDLVVQPPFLLWDMVQCSIAAGVTPEWLSTVMELALDPGEFLTAFLAMELETGTASGGLGLVGNATYTPAVATSSAVSLSTAIANLESYLATQSGAGKPGMRGVIHLTPGLLVLAAEEGLVEWRDGRYQTATGTTVIGDAGHTGQATPHGQAAPGANEAWIYATADIWYAVGQVHGARVVSGEEGGGAFYQPHNDLRPQYERAAIVAFDPHVLGAALVSTSETVSPSSGGSTEPTYVVEAFAADEAIAAANYLHGFTIRETSGTDPATVSIHHGSDNTGPVVSYINLAASESVPLTMLAARLPVPNGLYIDVETGAVEGSIVYEA